MLCFSMLGKQFGCNSAQSALYPVSDYGVANFFGNGKANANSARPTKFFRVGRTFRLAPHGLKNQTWGDPFVLRRCYPKEFGSLFELSDNGHHDLKQIDAYGLLRDG